MVRTGARFAAIAACLMAGWTFEDALGIAPPDASPAPYAYAPSVACLASSSDGKWLAVPGDHETLIFDAREAVSGTPKIAHRLMGAAPHIRSLQFSPDGQRIAVAGGSTGRFGELQIWNVAKAELIASRRLTADSLSGLSWSPDGLWLAVGGADARLYVVSSDDLATRFEQSAAADWVLASTFSVDGQFVASTGRDGPLRLTETATGQFVDVVTSVSPNLAMTPQYAVDRHPQRDQVAVGGEDGTVRTYMLRRRVDRRIGDDSQLVCRYPELGGRIFALAFDPSGTRIAAAASDGKRGRVGLLNVPDAWEPPPEIREIQAKEVDERTQAEANLLEQRHTANADLIATIDVPSPVYAIAFSADGGAIFASGSSGQIAVIDCQSGKIATQFDPFPRKTPDAEPERKPDGGASPEPSVGVGDSVEFLTDVMPILGKLGCNAGTCHGVQGGKNGFALSLRGYDPWRDYLALTDDLSGRRVDRHNAEASLMLLKPTGALPHEGGARLSQQDPRFDVLKAWIDAGATYRDDAPRVESIEVTPAERTLSEPGHRLDLQVKARLSNGSTRDVTRDAFYSSSDEGCAVVDGEGGVVASRRGETAILVRYEGCYASCAITVLGDREGFSWSAPESYGPIDDLIDAKLRGMMIAPSDLCTDAEFLRRVMLDLTGLPPTPDAIREFLADERPSRKKREAIVDRLIGSEAYIEHQTNRWADLLFVNSRLLGAEGAISFRSWIRNQIADNVPYNRFVASLLTATGSNRDHPAASYIKVLRTPELIAETSTQLFLGVRFNCNKCHDHPFERWTQDDYYALAAFFSRVRLAKAPQSGDQMIPGSAVEPSRPLYEHLDDGGANALFHPRLGRRVDASFPYEALASIDPVGEEIDSVALRRQAAAWWTSPNNRYFASSYVNRVWAQLMGVGLIEPVDDIRAGNPPSNPALLAWLTDDFAASDFNVRRLHRTICTSRTYQLSSATNRWNEDDRRNYSRALPRRLPAEVLFDAVHVAAGAAWQIPGAPVGLRAGELPDVTPTPSSGLLEKLGRPARENSCECARSNDLQLGPIMALVNGPDLAEAINDPSNALAKLADEITDNDQLIDEVFLRFVGDFPNAEQRSAARQQLTELKIFEDEHAEVARAFALRMQELEAHFDAWRQSRRPIAWTNFKAPVATSTFDTTFEQLDDGSLLASGGLGIGPYRIEGEVPLEKVLGLRLETLSDARLPGDGPGRSSDGNFILSQVRVFAAPPGSNQWKRVKLRDAKADYSSSGSEITNAIDAEVHSGWSIAGATGVNHEAVFRFARAVGNRGATRIAVELDHQGADEKSLLGRFRLTFCTETPRLTDQTIPDDIRALLALAPVDWSVRQSQRVRSFYLDNDATYRQLRQASEGLSHPRRAAVQDLAWALLNSPAFLFNH